jgi:hypothetical protein
MPILLYNLGTSTPTRLQSIWIQNQSHAFPGRVSFFGGKLSKVYAEGQKKIKKQLCEIKNKVFYIKVKGKGGTR